MTEVIQPFACILYMWCEYMKFMNWAADWTEFSVYDPCSYEAFL